MINNRILSVIYKSFIVLFGLCGLSIGLGITRGFLSFRTLDYFTYLSNLLVFIYFIINIIYSIKDIKNYGYKGTTVVLPKVKGAMTMSITITFVIYHFFLSATVFSMGEPYKGYNILSLMLHYIVPIMSIIDFIVFDKKGVYNKTDPLIWISIPSAYFIFVLIRAYIGKPFSNGSRYPYFFFDINKYGIGHVLINAVLLAIGFLVLGYLIYFIDNILSKLINKKDTA